MKQNRLKVKIASYLLLQRKSRILMTRRFNTGWSDGMYSLPSGHIDQGEFPLETIVREAEEEVNVQINPMTTELVHIHFQKDTYVDFYFRTQEWQGEIKINEPDKCDKIVWVELNEIDNLEIPEKIKTALSFIAKGEFYSQGD
ncbi:NUDIX domain-containing protein [Candidatus Dojkabacteria bacterium]|uniref:8-oxo-dGTP diphosphatase n=1 Tax=Candidatus Dojkabacteria bacterium TaxID=2099670 RepID=A0A955IAE9_9BACT|nr:NUDIX domain-containing protein [Candidatus Dojkabacteria bacterium]